MFQNTSAKGNERRENPTSSVYFVENLFLMGSFLRLRFSCNHK